VKTELYEDHGLRFEYPPDWTIEASDEDDVTTLDLQHPDGVAFVLVRIDESRPAPEYVADRALEAMREEYPDLDAAPVMESVGAHIVTGHDAEFYSLDVPNRATIRSFRTPRRTLLVFGQWSELGEDSVPDVVRGLLHSLDEFDD
jgi:hypothetical protein